MRRFAPILTLAGLLGACALGGNGAPRPAGDLPGAESFLPELRAELTKAVAAEGRDYVPRTRHLMEDGGPKYTNRLILESSPYLRQHAHNPVNWYPWGDEAFETARRLGRPVLLSIGYSTCHWCHVMEEESFEDEEIATYMNANYIAIKVDREERPDLDAIYMSAVQLLAGRGGWPMTTWLTADGQPFFGGTYFPARDGERGKRTGFLTLLRELRITHDRDPDGVAERAESITSQVRQRMLPVRGSGDPGEASLVTTATGLRAVFDPENGGRRGAPKFPSSMPTGVLLRHYRRTGDEAYLELVRITLEKMAAGGIHDQVGGGFHRYSTDATWLVPHFEKMLYDNALLTVAYLDGFQATGDPRFAEVARRTLEYVEREMTSPEGAFYSATDADSLTPGGHREEGWFFTWTPAEIAEVLGAERAKAFNTYYGVTDKGNFEGRNILHVTREIDEVASELQISPDELARQLADARSRLYEVRLERPPPLRDDKILTAWNGLMITAFARAAFVLDEPRYAERAKSAANLVLAKLRQDGRLLRSYMNGQARHQGYLEDYAFMIAGLLDLYESTFELRWLGEAVALQAELDSHYLDADGGGYFMTADDHEVLLAREKPTWDGAEPSGNSIALMNLSRLAELTTDDRYRAAASKMIRGFSAVLTRSPRGAAELVAGLDFHLDRTKEVVIVAPDSLADAQPFLSVLRETYLPNRVLIVAKEGEDLRTQVERIPLLQGKVAREGRATAYVCEQGVCLLPTSDVQVFKRQLTEPAVTPTLTGS